MWYIVLIKFSVSDAILRFILLPHVKGRLLLIRKLSPGRMFINVNGSHVAQGLSLPGLSGPILPQEEPKLSEAREEWKAHAPISRGTEQAGGLCHLAAPPPQEADWHQVPTAHSSNTHVLHTYCALGQRSRSGS